MSKLIFDLDENLSFDNFETMSLTKLKNSPTASTLRGKGSFFSAENFTFNNKIKVVLTLKRKYTDNLSILMNLYSLFRTKVYVFLQNDELFKKSFPGVALNNKEELINICRKQINNFNNLADNPSIDLNNKDYKKLIEELKQFAIANQLFDTPEEYVENLFVDSDIKEFIVTNKKASTTPPFLVMLQKINLTTLPDTADGYSVELNFNLFDGIFDEEKLTSYRELKKEFGDFYNNIFSKQASLLDKKDDFKIKITHLDNSKVNIKRVTDKTFLTEKAFFDKEIIFNEDMITQFQIVSYNQIAEVPIQGKSKPLSQYLGVGETNITLNFYFKDTNERFNKIIERLQFITELEQRQVRINVDFPILNAMDFHSLELSDFYLNTDEETDGELLSVIFKCSGYKYNNELFNLNNEKINELPLHALDKNFKKDELYTKYFNMFLKSIKLEDFQDLVIDSNAYDNFTFLDFINAYNKVSYDSTKNDLSDFYEAGNFMSEICNFIEEIGFFDQDFKIFTDSDQSEIVKIFSNKVTEYKTTWEKKYNSELTYIVNSLIPSNAYENFDYYRIEFLKIILIDYIVSIPEIFYEFLFNIKSMVLNLIQNTKMNISESAITDKTYEWTNKIHYDYELLNRLKYSIFTFFAESFINRIKSEEVFGKAVSILNISKIENSEFLNEDGGTLTIEEIKKNLTNTREQLIAELYQFFDGKNNDSFSNSFQKIETITNIRIIGEKYLYNKNINERVNFLIPKETLNNYQVDFNVEFANFLSAVICFPFTIDYNVENNYLGMLSEIMAKKLMQPLIDSTLLIKSSSNSTEEEQKLRKSLKTQMDLQFGSGFFDVASLFYSPLTTNLSLNDLGNYLGIRPKNNYAEEKILYQEFFDILDIEGSKDSSYITLLKTFKKINDGFFNSNKTGTEQIIDDFKSNSNEDVEDFYDELLGFEKQQILFDNNYQDLKNYNFNSEVLNDDNRLERIKSTLKYKDLNSGITALFSSDLDASVPSYDIYVVKKQHRYSSFSSLSFDRIENFFGMDKLLSLSIQFTKEERMKFASLSFIDSTEDYSDYGFKTDEFINIKDFDPKNKSFFEGSNYDSTKATLELGDEISIYLGTGIKNKKCVFNGIVKEISYGKIKQINCVSYASELLLKHFDLYRSTDSIVWETKENIKQFFQKTNRHSLKSIYNAKSKLNNYNSHLIPDEFKIFGNKASTADLSSMNQMECSSYALLMDGLSKTFNSLKHFKNSDDDMLSVNLANATQRKDSIFDKLRDYGTYVFSNENLTKINSNLVKNINNVDFDLGFYGSELIPYSNHNITSDYSLGDATNREEKFIVKNLSSSFTTVNADAFYRKDDITMMDLLKDLEKRAPGVWFDVLDDGFYSSLFFGRNNYYQLKENLTTENKYYKENGDDFVNEIVKNSFLENYDFFNSYKILLNSVSSFSSNSLEFKNNDNLEKLKKTSIKTESSQNKLYAITGKNLISNNLSVNESVYNKITIDYNPRIDKKIGEIFTAAKFISKVELFALPVLEDHEDRIKELVVKDDNATTWQQALEIAQATLQEQLESYYNGTIIITFNPEIRYKTELVLHDTINNIYGSVIVKDFEHKFDSRGAYTIITPMMKVESSTLSKDVMSKGWLSKFIYSFKEDKEWTNSLLMLENKKRLKSFLEILEKNASSEIPFIAGSIYVSNEGKKDESRKIKSLSTSSLMPLKLYPVSYNGTFLVPDLDIYNESFNGFFTKFRSFFYKQTNNIINVFRGQKNKSDYFSAGIWSGFANHFRNKFNSLTSYDKEFIDNVSQNSFLRNFDTTKTKVLFNSMKDVILDNKYFDKLNDYPIKKFITDDVTIGHLNCKALTIYDDVRIKNICRIMSNFDIVFLTEISDYDLKELNNNNISFHLSITDFLEKIKKEISKYNLYKHNIYFEARKKGLVTSDGTNTNEYYFVLSRYKINESKELKIEIDVPNFVGSIDLTKENSRYKATINSRFIEFIIPSNNFFKTKSKISIVPFHNVYFSNTDASDYYMNLSRIEGLKQCIQKSAKLKTDVIIGDFNISMFKTDTDTFSATVGEVIKLTEYEPEGYSLTEVAAKDYTPLIYPYNNTTVASDYLKNSYDQVLAYDSNFFGEIGKVDRLRTGVFTEVLVNGYNDYIINVSDHLPVYTTIKI